MRLTEVIHPVNTVETVGEGPRHLQMLLLVLAYRHEIGLVNQDVGRHQGGIGQEAGTHMHLVALFFRLELARIVASRHVFHQFLLELIPVLLGFFLERSATHQFTKVHVHIEEHIKLGGFGKVTLGVNGHFFGIHAASDIGSQYLFDILAQMIGMGMGRKAMVVGNEEIAIVFVLHPDEVAQSTEIVPKMQVPCGADAAHYYLFHVSFFRVLSLTKWQM